MTPLKAVAKIEKDQKEIAEGSQVRFRIRYPAYLDNRGKVIRVDGEMCIITPEGLNPVALATQAEMS